MTTASVRIRHLLDLGRGRVPGQLIIQLTDQCNARCPQCGMRVSEKFARTRLANDRVKRLLDAAIQRGIQIVSFTGGEPLLLLDDLIVLINYAGKLGFAYIRTGTNGFLFRNPEKSDFNERMNRLAERLAATPLRNLWISVDSAVPAMHEHMRGFPGVIEGIARALPIFHEHGIYPSANVGLNRNMSEETAGLQILGAEPSDEAESHFYQVYRQALRQFYGYLTDLGFSMTSACYPMSIQPTDDSSLQSVYAATAMDMVVNFSRREKILLYRALSDTVEEYRDRIRILTPLSSLRALIAQTSGTSLKQYPCRGGIDYFFVDCRDGLTYPCGYRGNDSLGYLWDLDMSSLDDSKKDCFLCDWECFRDPSELFGPIVEGLRDPRALFSRYRLQKPALQAWWQDIRYARACNFFDGRKPLVPERLRSFQKTLREEGCLVKTEPACQY